MLRSALVERESEEVSRVTLSKVQKTSIITDASDARDGHGVARGPDRHPQRADQLPDGALQDPRQGPSLPARPDDAGRPAPPAARLPEDEGREAVSRPHREAGHPQVAAPSADSDPRPDSTVALRTAQGRREDRGRATTSLEGARQTAAASRGRRPTSHSIRLRRRGRRWTPVSAVNAAVACGAAPSLARADPEAASSGAQMNR